MSFCFRSGRSAGAAGGKSLHPLFNPESYTRQLMLLLNSIEGADTIGWLLLRNPFVADHTAKRLRGYLAWRVEPWKQNDDLVSEFADAADAQFKLAKQSPESGFRPYLYLDGFKHPHTPIVCSSAAVLLPVEFAGGEVFVPIGLTHNLRRGSTHLRVCTVLSRAKAEFDICRAAGVFKKHGFQPWPDEAA